MKKVINTRGGVIVNLIEYLENCKGREKEYFRIEAKCKTLEPIGNWCQEEYESENGIGEAGKMIENCTLSSLCNLMRFYRSHGYDKIPEEPLELYYMAKNAALSYQIEENGKISPFYYKRIAQSLWKMIGYEQPQPFTKYMKCFAYGKKRLDAGQPFVYSMMNGCYKKHTVVVCGYATYSDGKKEYLFYVILDNWNRQYRYLCAKEFRISAMTVIEKELVEKDRNSLV